MLPIGQLGLLMVFNGVSTFSIVNVLFIMPIIGWGSQGIRLEYGRRRG